MSDADTRHVPVQPTAESVVLELIQDVEAAHGSDQEQAANRLRTDGDWPDLAETYRHAKTVLERNDQLVLLTSDHPGEDQSYIVGALLVPGERLEGLENTIARIQEQLQARDGHVDDHELLLGLEQEGCLLVPVDKLIQVR